MSAFIEDARRDFMKRRMEEIFTREEGRGSQKLRGKGGAHWPVRPERQGPCPFFPVVSAAPRIVPGTGLGLKARLLNE